MSLESRYFRRDYYYNAKQVERYVSIIKTSEEKRSQAYKNLVFRMMKDIVKKNISNYLNLLSSVEIPELPERDELIADCYIIFDKCTEKYEVNAGYNFYFYYNKSLSRYFFRNYQKEMKKNNDTKQVTEVLQNIDRTFHSGAVYGSEELVMDNLHFTELEKRISRAKMNGKNTDVFLKENPDVSSAAYSKALKSLRDKLKEAKNNDEI